MHPTDTEVFKHLTELKNYFDRDIEQLHFLSETAESEEIRRGMVGTTTMRDGSTDNSYRERIPWPPIPRCTIPQSLTLFSMLDFLGYLVETTDPDPIKTEKHFITFFKKAVDLGVLATALPDKQVSLLNRCTRQGMVHHYFAKQDLEISYHSSNPSDKLFFINEKSGGIVLNVNELKKIVLGVYDKIIKSGDHALYLTMEDNFQSLTNGYTHSIDPLIEEVKNSL